VSRFLAVIPARHQSSRFPGKPLAQLLGKPMIQHVWERCQEAKCFDEVWVATDDDRISRAVRNFGGRVELTSATCASGTDRVAEVARNQLGSPNDVFINVQGDEPAVAPESLATLAATFADAAVHMATLVRPLAEHERGNPNVVKVVRAEAGHALYFSRADLPFPRESVPVQRWAHVGIYGYRRQTLLRISALAATPLERAESLEQLRALGHGVQIFCAQTDQPTQAVDSPEDVPLAEAALRRLLSHTSS
jgi:3-deoxy-manno-octulosonate cytidylyltransferase (CMP-KDO synthetase)